MLELSRQLASNSNRTYSKLNKFEWECAPHCHCRLPDDGNKMYQCKRCKTWYHKNCESGNFESPEWICITCDKKEKLRNIYNKEKEKKEKAKKEQEELKKIQLQELRGRVEKEDGHAELVLLYNTVNKVAIDSLLEDGEMSVGYVSADDMENVTSDPSSGTWFGCVQWFLDEYFVVINKTLNKTPRDIIETLIHEMAHVTVHKKGYSDNGDHGQQFKRIGSEITRKVNLNNEKHFPFPYSSFTLKAKVIVAARGHVSS